MVDIQIFDIRIVYKPSTGLENEELVRNGWFGYIQSHRSFTRDSLAIMGSNRNNRDRNGTSTIQQWRLDEHLITGWKRHSNCPEMGDCKIFNQIESKRIG